MINRLIISNLLHRPIRTLLSVLAIGVEVTMMLTLVGISYGTLHGAARRAQGVGADVLVRPPGASVLSFSTAPLSENLLGFFMKQPHVTFATGTMIQPLGGIDSLTGIDAGQFDRLSGGFTFLRGGPMTRDDEIIVDEYYAREHRLQIGSTITLVNHPWRVAGVYESGKLARICLRLPVIQDLTGNPKKLSQIYLKVDDPAHARAVVDDLRAKLPGYSIYTMEEFTSLLTISSVGLLRNFIGVVIGVAAIVGFIVVFMAMYTAVIERTREVGILKALGASPAYILNMLFRETLVLAAAGVLLGILMTYGTQWLMAHAVPASLTQETVYWWWPIAALIAIGGALLGAIFPGIKAVNQDAIQALAYE
ncbi:MAG TPA: ABC transporter permease [Candidatus Saccharimonadales bacterium]|nr:ABC transporter permease [Candidatus Saccharimonadales bacterium]